MITENEPKEPAGGNTVTPAFKGKKEESPNSVPTTDNQCIHYCFTYNNYTEEGISKLLGWFDKNCYRWIFQEEIASTGTPHLQGFYSLKKKDRFLKLAKYMDMKISFRLSIDNNANYRNAIWYCANPAKRKEDGRLWNHNCEIIPKEELKVIISTELYEWQKELCTILKGKRDDRKVYWYWSNAGETGKTCFCKYLYLHFGAITLEGKRDNILNGIVNYYNAHGMAPKIVIWDIARATKDDCISYEAIEKIKNMFFFSGKYEGTMICGNPPHLVIFSNKPPLREKLSMDRWVIKNIDKPNMFEGTAKYGEKSE